MEEKMLLIMQQVLDKVGNIETEIKGINIKLDKLESKVDKLEVKVDNLDKKMNDGFDTLEILQHETNKSVINLKVEVKKLDNRLTGQVAHNLELIEEIKCRVH